MLNHTRPGNQANYQVRALAISHSVTSSIVGDEINTDAADFLTADQLSAANCTILDRASSNDVNMHLQQFQQHLPYISPKPDSHSHSAV